MTTISGFADGILDGTIPPESEKKYLQIISSETKRLARLVRSMLELSRLQAKDRATLLKNSFDISEQLRLTLITFADKIDQKHLEVVFNVPEEAIKVLGDVDAITQVIYNLLDNAICAAAQAYPPEVYVRVRKTGEEYLLSVRNRVQRDVELPPDGQLPRTTRKEPGHGMGLSNVRDVLLRHGAEYTLSCRDNWFRFTCAVPTDNS